MNRLSLPLGFSQGVQGRGARDWRDTSATGIRLPTFIYIWNEAVGEYSGASGKVVFTEATWPLIETVRDFLGSCGVESYLVGGAVRDALLGRDTADLDISVAGDARKLAWELADALGGRYVLLDELHQVARAVLVREGRRWFVDLSTLRGDILSDLGSRDFTIDAMALPLIQADGSTPERWLSAEQLIDPYGGVADLGRRQVRAVGPGVFQRDPVRLLRAVRLAAQLGFSIEAVTQELLRSQAALVAGGSAERVRDELCLMLAHAGAASHLRQLYELGLLLNVVPELAPTVGSEQPKEHFWDVFEHSLETVAALALVLQEKGANELSREVPWSERLAQHFDQEVSSGHNRRTLLKLAALLHDIAKPQTRSVEESGRIRFLSHAVKGASLATTIMEHLRFSNREISLVETAIRYHLRPLQMSGDEALPTPRAIYRYFRDAGEAAIDTLFLSLADHLAARGPMLDFAGWRAHAEQVRYVLEEHFREVSVTRPPKLVDGHDLIGGFGLKPGPLLGQLLEMVREAQAAGEVHTKEEALALVKRYLGSSNIR